MPIASTDLIAYGALTRVTDDTTANVGGGIDTKNRPVFTQLTANAVIVLQSTSASDGAGVSVTVTGRNAAGAIVSDTFALNGTSETSTAGRTTFERVHSVLINADAVGTITVKQGAAGSTIGTIPVGERGFYAMFINSSSSGSQETRYEKFFWYNKHATLTLSNAIISLTADPDNKITIGVEATTGGTTTAANRKSVPSSNPTFVDNGVDQTISGGLPALTGIAVWVKQILAINDGPLKSSFTTQLRGTTV